MAKYHMVDFNEAGHVVNVDFQSIDYFLLAIHFPLILPQNQSFGIKLTVIYFCFSIN